MSEKPISVEGATTGLVLALFLACAILLAAIFMGIRADITGREQTKAPTTSTQPGA